MIINAQTGQIVQQANYSSFGETTFKSGDFISLGFAGGITDEDSDLIKFGARDFDPQTGRWTSKDPIRFDGDAVNIYRYVNNDPVNLIDPNGEDPRIFLVFAVCAATFKIYVSSVLENIQANSLAKNKCESSGGTWTPPSTLGVLKTAKGTCSCPKGGACGN